MATNRFFAGLLLIALVTGCAMPRQAKLASELYLAALSSHSEILKMEDGLVRAIDAHDAAAIEAMIIRIDDMRRTWVKQSAPATGAMAQTADLYKQALDLRAKEFEFASSTAIYRRVEDSREMLRSQVAAMDLTDQALEKLESLRR